MATNLDILESELKNEVYGLEKELAVLGKREGYKKRVFEKNDLAYYGEIKRLHENTRRYYSRQGGSFFKSLGCIGVSLTSIYFLSSALERDADPDLMTANFTAFFGWLIVSITAGGLAIRDHFASMYWKNHLINQVEGMNRGNFLSYSNIIDRIYWNYTHKINELLDRTYK